MPQRMRDAVVYLLLGFIIGHLIGSDAPIRGKALQDPRYQDALLVTTEEEQ